MDHFETLTGRCLQDLWLHSLTPSIRNCFETLFIAVIGAIALNAVYVFFRTEWPRVYTSLDSRVDYQYKRHPLKTVVGFRGLPVAVVTAITAEMIDRSGGDVKVGSGIMIVTYLSLSTGRALRDIVTPPRDQNYVLLVLYHVVQITVVLLFSAMGLIAHDLWGPWIPSFNDLMIALFAGSFAAVMAIWAKDVMSTVYLDDSQVVDQLRNDVGHKLIGYARRRCRVLDRSGNLGHLVEAILLAEAQQRPKWFRKLERLSGIFGREGTYGVAQVRSKGAISDELSISVLIGQLIRNAPGPFEAVIENQDELQKLLRSHNPDDEHVNRIATFLGFLIADEHQRN